MRRALSLSLFLGLGACASGQMASLQDDQEAKQFAPPAPDRGALYIYRHEMMGFVKPIEVRVAGGSTGTLPINTYMRLEGPPGPIEVDCKVGDKQGALQVDIADGRTRFVEVSMTTGLWAPGCQMAEVPPDQGQAAVRASRRVVQQAQ